LQRIASSWKCATASRPLNFFGRSSILIVIHYFTLSLNQLNWKHIWIKSSLCIRTALGNFGVQVRLPRHQDHLACP
jgi:hypothetical protein